MTISLRRWSGVVLVLVAGCTLISGLEEFTVHHGAAGADAGAPGGSGGTAGTGGTGGTETGSGGTGGTATGSGGAGGTGGTATGVGGAGGTQTGIGGEGGTGASAPTATSCSLGPGGGGGSGGDGGGSASNGIDDCGPNADENCCATLLVDGGTYYRSYDGIDFTDDSYPATVSDFYLDRFEVTVGRFRKFVDAGKGTQADPPADGDGAHPLISGSGWDEAWNTYLPADTVALKDAVTCSSSYETWTDDPDENETLPINCVSWYEAFAFCAWDEGRLPTEAEWNYAAAGGGQQRYYPWSAEYPPGSTDIDYDHAVYDCMGDGVGGCSFSDILAVGSRPLGDGRWDQADLGGSMWEWNLDRGATYPMPCDNCANLNSTDQRSRRGGSWGNGADELRAAKRGGLDPADRGSTLGVRCARSPW